MIPFRITHKQSTRKRAKSRQVHRRGGGGLKFSLERTRLSAG